MPLATDRNTPMKDGELIPVPVAANAKIYGGALVVANATGFAAHTDGRNYVTQTSALHFLRNQSEGEIQADARVRHRGHSTCLVAVDILGEDEKLLATGEFTFFCVDPEIMARKVKKA